jgi:hypothetical protein
MRIEFRFRILGMLGRDTIPGSPEIDILALDERRDQIVLGAEVPIETRLCDTSLLNDQVDPNGANASPVKKIGCCLENFLAHVQGAGIGYRRCAFRLHVGAPSSDSQQSNIALLDTLQTCLY